MPNSSGRPLEVFLSHATADREHVELVRGQIEALGVSVYLAEHDLKPGTSLAGKVDAALRRAGLVVVLITSTSANSHFVQQEIGAAVAYRKPIIPIVDSRVVGEIDLAMLAGTEHLVLDLAQPTEALRQITASLQSFIVPLPPALNSQPKPPAIDLTDTETLLLLGAVVILAVLFFGQSGPASA
jgi:hypothetical protein